MKDSKMIAIIAILLICYLTVVISIDTCKTKTLLSQIKETNDFKTVLNEKNAIHIEKIYFDETKGYEYFEQIENRIVYESKTNNEFINVEDAIIYTKNINDDVKIDVTFNNNVYELPLLINELTTSITNQKGGLLKRTFYFDKETYYLNKIVEEEFDNLNNFLNSTTSIVNYGKKINRTRDAIITADGDNPINLYLIKNKDTNKETARFIKASKNCKYITATNWNKENYNFKLSFDNDQNNYNDVLSLENRSENQVLIYVTG